MIEEDEPIDPNVPNGHHVFCNFFHRPRKGCKMCKRFFDAYKPKPGETSEELALRYFPDLEIRK